MTNKSLSVTEAADRLNCAAVTVRSWLGNDEKRSRYFPGAVKPDGRTWAIPAEDIKAMESLMDDPDKVWAGTGRKPFAFRSDHTHGHEVYVSCPDSKWESAWPMIQTFLSPAERFQVLYDAASDKFTNGKANGKT